MRSLRRIHCELKALRDHRAFHGNSGFNLIRGRGFARLYASTSHFEKPAERALPVQKFSDCRIFSASPCCENILNELFSKAFVLIRVWLKRWTKP
jgi:hypothetical protein